MFFYRKAYNELKKWKENYADDYAIMIEGARRIGKSTVAEQFARNEYESCIIIDFAKAPGTVLACFDDISDLDLFFINLQAATGKILKRNASVIVFDEVQMFPRARQAIKYLVADGRYHYIETGSLISIKKNVKDIVIPSEEMRLNMYPMDYEEFMLATGDDTFGVRKELYLSGRALGQELNRKLMRDFRIYMAVGGMPQAVEAYISGKSFSEIDAIKRKIIRLYEDDLKKIDASGRISMIYDSIPAQLAKGTKRFSIAAATGKRKTSKDEEILYELIDSRTVLIAYDTTDPRSTLSQTKNIDHYKLYLADTGLFVTMMFKERPSAANEIYTKLLSGKLSANLGYLYENAVAQVIASSDRQLFFHTWEKKGSTHYYEVDFLLSEGTKVVPLEVKSSGVGRHESLSTFVKKYSQNAAEPCIISQKDAGMIDGIKNIPVHMVPFLVGGEK